ncbi:HlyD family secretion protein [Pseudoduganella flava]|uniref:Efflux RND transporter periplasmic adaptor subunit n=1 Tax=Pseudoduganella flava TaxID=871742 RepID=A0A562PRK8_9BURK|nr:efflux RND transporter periplasmic adaptor subunit [Pseudoduganella flava]QGZ37958.1 efflux RND transporter periplasmic adaptor subunit [Pseudoduganella flava]TWI46800.1 HlyD family secretion protein [Pseudoduganella flava]
MNAPPSQERLPPERERVPSQQAVQAALAPARRWPRWTGWLLAAVLLAGALGGTAWWHQRAAQTRIVYDTTPVTRGDLRLTVTANGTLQPTRTANIGSELSGIVARVDADVNDRVRTGQVLVELDTAKLNDQVQRSRAMLAAADAATAQAIATRTESAATLRRLDDMSRMSGGTFPSRADLDAARAAAARAEAAVHSAAANAAAARAALATDVKNLARAAIRAPFDGMILSRNVEPGNAVAASLQAVTLFTLAEDLHRLRLLVNVDEADVGAVRVGQHATFTVSSWPERQYPAAIARLSYGSTIADNVVTYVAWLDVDNADLSLRPGMTATATIAAAVHAGVLLVPNGALRYTPAEMAHRPAPGIASRLLPRPAAQQRSAGTAAAPGSRVVWVLQGGVPAPVQVTTGLSDGRHTEVTGGALRPGMAVITGQHERP